MRTVLTIAVLSMCVPFQVRAADVVNRWTATQFDGGGIERGDPITLFWSIVPDGESYERSANSDLVDYLDDGWNVSAQDRTPILTNRPWWDVMKSAYDQYERVSGLRMQYRSEQNAFGQDTGLFGDIRIGGEVIDGDPGGVLADNVFPNGGDMRVDTSRDGNGVPSVFHTDEALWRNLISHESGHGIGLGHPDIAGADAVMEAGIQGHFFGLQFDDIYGFNRNYGDPREKNGGNDSLGSSLDLGTFSHGSSASLGGDAIDSVVEEFDDDWLGIDGATDEDWFKLTFPQTAVVDIRVTPVGPTYQLSGQTFDASSQSDLRFEVYNSSGILQKTVNNGGLGIAEELTSQTFLQSGDYYVRVLGEEDSNQFYQLDVDVELPDLLLTVNRDTGEMQMSGLSVPGVEFDGYRIQSPSGSLDPADGAWLSFEDQNILSWQEANPTTDSVQELLPLGTDQLSDADTVSLGDFYSQVLSAPFGTPEEGDIAFSYLTPATGSVWLNGAVHYLGDAFLNNLVVTIDPTTGEAKMVNESNTTIQIDGYSLSSLSASLDPNGWSSFDEQMLLDWRESNASDSTLSELEPFGTMTILPGEIFDLGQPFDILGTQDIELSFLLAGEGTFRAGSVVYEQFLAGDFDNDGDVDGFDFLEWQRNPGIGELSDWETNYGASIAANALAVPEPHSLAILILLVFGLLISRGRSSRIVDTAFKAVVAAR